MRADRERRVLERDQLFNDAPIDRTFCPGILGNCLQAGWTPRRIDAGSIREFLDFRRRRRRISSLLTISRILVKSKVFLTRDAVRPDPDRRRPHAGVDAGIEHRPDDILAIDLEQGVRGIGLDGRNGPVERCRRETVQRDLEDVAFVVGFDTVDLVGARERHQLLGVFLNHRISREDAVDDLRNKRLISIERLLEFQRRERWQRRKLAASRRWRRSPTILRAAPAC